MPSCKLSKEIWGGEKPGEVTLNYNIWTREHPADKGFFELEARPTLAPELVGVTKATNLNRRRSIEDL